MFLCRNKVVDSCLVLCCLRFGSCNPQRATTANFPVICLKFTSWKVNHLHALVHTKACSGVALWFKDSVVSQGDSCSSQPHFSRWPPANLHLSMQPCWQQITSLVTFPQTYIWLNLNSLSMTVTKKTRKINLPSSGNWQVHVAPWESLAFSRSCIPPTHCNLFIIACCRRRLKGNQYWIKNWIKNSIIAAISRESSKILPQLRDFLLQSHPSRETTLQKASRADKAFQLLMSVVIILLLTVPWKPGAFWCSSLSDKTDNSI